MKSIFVATILFLAPSAAWAQTKVVDLEPVGTSTRSPPKVGGVKLREGMVLPAQGTIQCGGWVGKIKLESPRGKYTFRCEDKNPKDSLTDECILGSGRVVVEVVPERARDLVCRFGESRSAVAKGTAYSIEAHGSYAELIVAEGTVEVSAPGELATAVSVLEKNKIVFAPPNTPQVVPAVPLELAPIQHAMAPGPAPAQIPTWVWVIAGAVVTTAATAAICTATGCFESDPPDPDPPVTVTPPPPPPPPALGRLSFQIF